jgi:hypothetical protein
MPGIKTVAVKGPSDVDAALELFAADASSDKETV